MSEATQLVRTLIRIGVSTLLSQFYALHFDSRFVTGDPVSNDDAALASATHDSSPFVSTEEMRDEEIHTTPPELWILLGHGHGPPLDNPPFLGGKSKDEGLPFSFRNIPKKGWKEGEDRILHPKNPAVPSIPLFLDHREPEEVQGGVANALSVKCDREKLTVAVSKDSLRDSLKVSGSVWSSQETFPQPAAIPYPLFPWSYFTFEPYTW